MPKQLEVYGEQGTGGGWITSYCAGKTVECFLEDGEYLIIRFTDGHEAKIGWQSSGGNSIKGSPYLENLDVRIYVQGASLSAIGEL